MSQVSSEEDTLKQIVQRPYYTVRFSPLAQPLDLTLSDCRNLLQENAVRLRGWDFPHYAHESTFNAQEYLYTLVNWEKHLELWRFYRSGQFIYFGGSWDLAMNFQQQLRLEFDHNVLLARKEERESVVGLLSFVGIIYSVTEFFIFASRLSTSLKLPSFTFEIALRNVKNWALVSGQPGVPLHSFYQSKIGDIRLTRLKNDEIGADPVLSSRKALRELFESFQWMDSESAVKSWQERFMSGRFAS